MRFRIIEKLGLYYPQVYKEEWEWIASVFSTSKKPKSAHLTIEAATRACEAYHLHNPNVVKEFEL